MTRRDWLRSGLALVTGSAKADPRSTGDVAGLAGPPRMALAASREGPPRTVKAAYLSYYGIGDRTISAVAGWIRYFDRHPAERFVSDGDPDTVAVPKGRLDEARSSRGTEAANHRWREREMSAHHTSGP